MAQRYNELRFNGVCLLSSAAQPLPTRWESFCETVRTPILAEMLRHRAVAGFLAVLGVAQVATAARRVVTLVCPMA